MTAHLYARKDPASRARLLGLEDAVERRGNGSLHRVGEAPGRSQDSPRTAGAAPSVSPGFLGRLGGAGLS